MAKLTPAQRELVANAAKRFAKAHGESREISLEQFRSLLASAVHEAFALLLEEAGRANTAELDPLFRSEFLVELVAAFNGTLPLDHPHIVGIVVSDRLFHSAVLSRSGFPGIHDNLRRDIVPLIRVSNRFAAGDDITVDRIVIDFIGGEGETPPKDLWRSNPPA